MQLDELNDITASLRQMPDQALQRFAMMHKDDPYIMALAVSESTQRKKMRAAATTPKVTPSPTIADAEIAQMGMPDMGGIAALPAPNMETMNAAAGGIVGGTEDYDMAVGYADGGMVERYQSGGSTDARKRRFIEQYGAIADKVSAETGVSRDLLLSQWGLETAWGTKTVGQYNLGNIKDVTGKGPKALDKAEGSRDAYKTYSSPEEFAKDYTNLLKRNFPSALNTGSDVGAFTQGLTEGRTGTYATDPNYGKKLASTFTSLMPISTAQAAQPSAPAADREKLISQIPGQTAAGRTTAPEPERRPQDYLFGAGETGLAMLTGAVSPVTGLLRKAGQEIVHGKSEPMAQQMAATTFAPRGEAGQAMTQELGRFLTQDMKLPPYIPTLGGAVPRTSVPRTAAAADEAAALAAREATPRLPSPTTPATPGGRAQGIAALEKQKGTAEAASRASGAAQQEAAAARIAAERAGAVNADLPGAAQRAGLAGLAGVGASVAGEPPAEGAKRAAEPREDDGSYKRMEDAKFIRQAEEARAAAERMREVAGIKEEAPPEVKKQAKKEGWGPEDWITFGATLATTPGAFGTGVGKALTATMAGRREREKGETERAYKEALTKQAERPAAEIQLIERLQKDPKFATAYERYAMTKREPMTREKAMALWGGNMLLQAKYPNFEDFAKMAMSGMQGAAGPQLNSSDLALIQSYLR